MSYISVCLSQTKDTVMVWERVDPTLRELVEFNAPYYFYVSDPKGDRNTIFNTPVKKIDCGRNRSKFYQERKKYQDNRTRLWESDISPELRVLSNHYYNVPAPKLNITFLDVETDYKPELGFSGPKNPYAPINAISLVHRHTKELISLSVAPKDGKTWTPELLRKACDDIVPLQSKYKHKFIICQDERELLEYYLEEIQNSDILVGWNSEKFDHPYIAKRIELVLGVHRLRELCFVGADEPKFVEQEEKQRNFGGKVNPNAPKRTYIQLQTSGRIVADYIVLYKKYEQSEKPSYNLASVSDDVLVDENEEPLLPKLQYPGPLHNLYINNFGFFVRYNIRDTEILDAFEDILGYVDLANQMYHISCGIYEHVPGTLKLAELAIINHCHHVINKIVNNTTEPPEDKSIEGALVLLPKIGMHAMIGAIDIKSLYPSDIIALNISPEKLRGQFKEKERACHAIANIEDIELTFVFEHNGQEETLHVEDWIYFFKRKKWAISGYGTAFDQDELGIIPTVLLNWFNDRQRYNSLKKESGKNHQHDLEQYYDRLQYVYKIKLNSLYGALSNLYFRFYDLRMGESTTGTGRMILRHQCRKVNEILGGSYHVNFPMYNTIEDAEKRNHGPEVALHGPIYKGVFEAEHIIYGDSVAYNTVIDTQYGRRNIDQLFMSVDYTDGDKEYCNTLDFQCLTYDIETNTTLYQPIKYIMRHKCSKKMYRVWITNSQYIDVTEDHSLMGFVNTKYRKKYNSLITEIQPQNLNKDINSLVYAKNKPLLNVESKNLPIQLYELMGYVIGDGYVDTTPTGGTLISVGNKDLQTITTQILVPLQLSGWISSWYIKSNKHDIQISSAKLRKFLREHLYTDHIKHIPVWIKNENELNICGFLRGLLSADGFINKKFTVGYCSTREDYILETQELLFSCGIASTYFTETTENSYKGKFSNTFSKRLTIKNIDIFRDKIGFIPKEKQQKLLQYNPGRQKILHSKYDFEIVTVKKVEEIEYTDYVYDIEVEKTHTFFANNILVHNTDSTYFSIGCTDIDEAIKKADDVAAAVNASFPEFMRKTFLCQPTYDSRITTSREIVSDRGIFVEKKRYMLHLVDVEGKKVDKCKVMGLDTKKTTLPVPVSRKLNKFIERYLKGETWEEISKTIVEYKQELEKHAHLFDIGMPKGINNLENYTYEFKANYKTRIPGHVSAAIFYNQMLEQYEDKISLPINSGMKIKVFWLCQPIGRFKSIALPTDAEFVPEWFTENFRIDRTLHTEKLVDNPLQNILKAINKKPPSFQSLVVNDEWEF